MSIFPWSWSDGAVSLNIYDRDLADDITVWLPLTLTPPLLFPACITTVLPADVTDCNVKVWAVMFPWWDYPCVVTVPSSTFLLTILPLSQHPVLYWTVLFCTVPVPPPAEGRWCPPPQSRQGLRSPLLLHPRHWKYHSLKVDVVSMSANIWS